MASFSYLEVYSKFFSLSVELMDHVQSKQGAVEISLDPEFKGISSLLSDITKYRIISDKDGYAAIKISRALFQAYLKYRLTESHVREPNLEEENTLKLVLSYLIEVEEGKTPQLNLPDRTRKATKSVQTIPENDSLYSAKKGRNDNLQSDYYNETRNLNNSPVNLETPKGDYFSQKYSDRPRVRSRSPSPFEARHKRSASPSWRSHEDRSNSAKNKRNHDFYSYEEKYVRPPRDRENGKGDRRQRDLESPYDETRRSPNHYSRLGTSKEEFTSVKIIDGCKISRITRFRDSNENIRTNPRMSAIDYMSLNNEPEVRRNSPNESFSMKVKTAPTLSQARNVAATKLGLYTDLAKSAYRK